jgi:hypothetical protein
LAFRVMAPSWSSWHVGWLICCMHISTRLDNLQSTRLNTIIFSLVCHWWEVVAEYEWQVVVLLVVGQE